MDDWEQHFAAKTKRRAQQALKHHRLKHLRRWAFPLSLAAVGLFVLVVVLLYRP